ILSKPKPVEQPITQEVFNCEIGVTNVEELEALPPVEISSSPTMTPLETLPSPKSSHHHVEAVNDTVMDSDTIEDITAEAQQNNYRQINEDVVLKDKLKVLSSSTTFKGANQRLLWSGTGIDFETECDINFNDLGKELPIDIETTTPMELRLRLRLEYLQRKVSEFENEKMRNQDFDANGLHKSIQKTRELTEMNARYLKKNQQQQELIMKLKSELFRLRSSHSQSHTNDEKITDENDAEDDLYAELKQYEEELDKETQQLEIIAAEEKEDFFTNPKVTKPNPERSPKKLDAKKKKRASVAPTSYG
ncbi:hypothetical protein AKO1_002057, partial [Acrasis kona]